MNVRLPALAGAAAFLLSGCMVGPKYLKPSVPLAPEYKEANPDAYKENANWHVAQPADAVTRGEWWKIFGDAELNTLEPQVAANNQDLKAADARFREARALIRFNHAFLFPTVGTAPFAGGLRESTNRPYFNTSASRGNGVGDIQLPIDLNYEVDVWGRVRRTVSAAREEAQASAGDRQTVLLSLQAELAFDYFEARSADAQEKLLNDTVQSYEEAFRMREVLATEQGKARYALRQSTVEPVFGQIKEARGIRRFRFRGLQKATSEWKLICATHNLLKLFRHRRALVYA